MAGGYEVRNRHFKGCVAPKNISHIRQQEKQPNVCYLFEGLMDYLSFLTMRVNNNPQQRRLTEQDYMVLNSINNLARAEHHKMSDFVDFVKCYFPYAEKLMPMINFLRDRLRFKDSTIRKLCKFKNVTVSGSFYSSEFNRTFETKHSVYSIKQEENGNYDFKIDGVSHVSWFRKKRDEWREAMGIPKPRQTQNRGMKL